MAKAIGTILAAAAIGLASPVLAQMDPELGDVGAGGEAGGTASGTASGSFGAGAGTQTQTQSTGTWTPPTGQVPMQAPPPAAPPPEFGGEDDGFSEPADSGGSDHSRVVGRFGVGFFGVMTIPVMGCPNAPAGCTVDGSAGGNPLADVAAPTVGLRYWLDSGLALEGALGFSHTSGEFQSDVEMGAGATTRILLAPATPSVTAIALHGGVPLALAHSGHFVFEVVPQLNFGLATGSYEGAMAADTWDISGFLLEVGGKVGAEIHFGFIDIPQLSLQGSVGLSVRLESRTAEQAGPPKVTHEQSVTRISTGVDGDPWDIFTGSITAIYYL